MTNQTPLLTPARAAADWMRQGFTVPRPADRPENSILLTPEQAIMEALVHGITMPRYDMDGNHVFLQYPTYRPLPEAAENCGELYQYEHTPACSEGRGYCSACGGGFRICELYESGRCSNCEYGARHAVRSVGSTGGDWWDERD